MKVFSGISSDKILVYEKPVSMEELEINEGNGQDYGYLVYRYVSKEGGQDYGYLVYRYLSKEGARTTDTLSKGT